MPTQYYTPEEAASRLGLSKSCLAKWRGMTKAGKPNGPAWTEIGRNVRYSDAALTEYLAANTFGGVAA